MSRVIVFGGGLAGLAGAVALADAGCEVELYERRPILGGRATSFIHPSSGERVDNCQHVLLGCCVNLLDFYGRLGVADHIDFQETIPFIDESNRVSVIEPSGLPAPLHLLPSFLRLKTMGIRDKLSIVRTVAGMIRHDMRSRNTGYPETHQAAGAQHAAGAHQAAGAQHAAEPSPVSMAAWLLDHGATKRSVEAFWKPFLISALNDELDDIDADYGIGTAVRAFLLNRRGYEVGLPAVPLGDLYAPCIDYIERRGGRVVFNRGVTGISVHGGRVVSISLQDGSTVEAGAYLSALPFDVLCRLLPKSHASNPYFAMLAGLSVSPITAVHVWFDRPVTELDYAAVIGRRIQWIFNQSNRHAGANTLGNAGASSMENAGAYLGLVVSASDEWMKMPRQMIIEQAMDDLRSLLPAVRQAELLKAIVVKEGRATFAPNPGCDALRPGPSSPLSNFFLAGDWVQTGWPATMESAVRSGYQGAEALLRTQGVRTRILKSELPAEGLMKWLAGKRGI